MIDIGQFSSVRTEPAYSDDEVLMAVWDYRNRLLEAHGSENLVAILEILLVEISLRREPSSP